MKKVFIAAALFAALGFNAAYANTAIAPKTLISVTTKTEFEAIKTDQLPQVVKDALAKSYEGQTIKAAYVRNEEGVKTYKVTLADAEGKTSDVIFNEKGEVLPAGEQK